MTVDRAWTKAAVWAAIGALVASAAFAVGVDVSRPVGGAATMSPALVVFIAGIACGTLSWRSSRLKTRRMTTREARPSLQAQSHNCS